MNSWAKISEVNKEGVIRVDIDSDVSIVSDAGDSDSHVSVAIGDGAVSTTNVLYHIYIHTTHNI